MSWKGVSKAISRLPHQIMSRKSETTVDEDYDRVEKRFNEIVKQVEELKKHSSAFRNAVSELVEHQMNGALLIEQLYDPMMGVQESADGVVKRRSDEISNEAMQAAQDYGLAMTYCRDEILQELDKLDRCVVQPADQIHMIIKTIQKTITKRRHKLIDYDRYRTSLTKMKNIADRSPSEDKQVYKLESQLEVATQDYEYLNDMLKQDLVRFIRLANSFIQPVQDSFYNIQRSVIGGIYGRIYEVIDNHRGYFLTLEHPLPEGYQWRVAQRNVQSELEHLDLLQKGAQANPVLGRTNISLQERAAVRRAEQEGSTTTATSFAAAAPAKRAPPPPPPKPRVPKQPARQYVIALYDLDAQQEGDLSFRKDDKIEVLERTDNTMDWWKGRLGSQVGMFPANYVQEM